MTNLRILLLATTALTATPFATSASHAQTAPIVVAQAKEEGGPPGAKKEAPRGAPPPAAAPRAPTPPPPPAAAPPRPAAPPPPAAAPPPRQAPPPAAAPSRPTPPPPPPAAAPKAPPPPPPAAAPRAPATPPPPPAAAPARPTPPPPAAAPAAPKQPAAPTRLRRLHPRRRHRRLCRHRLPGWRQAAARADHHASGGGPSTWRNDSATAASRCTGCTDDASECGRSDNRADHAAGTTRRAAAGCAGRSCCTDNEPLAERCCTHCSGTRRTHGANRRSGRAQRHAACRPGTERPADRRAGLPAGAAGHRTAASSAAAGSRNQSHCSGYTTVRTDSSGRLPRPAPREPAGRPDHHHRARPDHHSRSRRTAICPSQRDEPLPLRRA